ncbi:MAG: glycosyltransferase family 4 protein [Chitinophagaceae bacterium]|nr:glycosyltransferase family 4 protein [Chitinophagaceae bacterium]
MVVAVNCWILRNKELDGIGYFTVNVLSRMIRNHPDVHFKLLCDKNFEEGQFAAPNVTIHKIFPPYRHPVLYFLYLEVVLTFFLRKHKPDILLSPDGMLSLLSGTKQLPVIHDINFVHRPEDLPFRNRLYYRIFFKRFARKAKRIATVSDYSRKDIAAVYKVPDTKIDVVYCGVSEHFKPLTGDMVRQVREKWTNGKPYFFFVGSMHPRKNIGRLIEAFIQFKEKSGTEHILVLAGKILWDSPDIKKVMKDNPFAKDIVFTGYVNDEDVSALLGASFALAFVPLFEGFGIPLIEAMHCKVPVICSDRTSLPEVAGDAAILVDPENTASVSDAMVRLVNEPALRQSLIEKGELRKELFTWEKTEAKLWLSIQKVLGAGQ